MYRILKPRILCVDDQPAVVELLAAVFGTHEEYAIEVETDPFAVVDRAKKSRPDLIILDISMPELDGIEVARLLRREPGICHTPIVFYSGLTELREPALQAAGAEHASFFAKGRPMCEMETFVEGLLSERLEVLHNSLPAWVRRQQLL